MFNKQPKKNTDIMTYHTNLKEYRDDIQHIKCTHCDREHWVPSVKAKHPGLKPLERPKKRRRKPLTRRCKLLILPAAVIIALRAVCRVVALIIWAIRRFYRRLWFGISWPDRFIDRNVKRWIKLYRLKRAMIAAYRLLTRNHCIDCHEIDAGLLQDGKTPNVCKSRCVAHADNFQKAKRDYFSYKYNIPIDCLVCHDYCRNKFFLAQNADLKIQKRQTERLYI